MKKKILSLATVCAFMFSCSNNNSEQKSTPIKVETEVAGMTAEVAGTAYVGKVEPQTSTAVSFTSIGTVQRVLVEEGQHVKAGQVLAIMDPTQCKNAVDAAQAMMNQAQDAYERMKILHDNNSLSEMDWVDVQTKLAQARSSLQMSKKALADCTLKAPCSGVVGEKNMQTGQTALTSQPVCHILNINNVKIKVSIPEKEIAKLTSTTPSRINIPAIQESIVGGRIEKGVQADAMTHTYDIHINVANPGERLLPGMVAEVTLNNNSAEGADSGVYLPIRCVQQSADGKHFVWVVKDKKSHRQNVTIGDTRGDRIEIQSGIGNGDKVIVSGYQKVSEGSEVECQE